MAAQAKRGTSKSKAANGRSKPQAASGGWYEQTAGILLVGAGLLSVVMLLTSPDHAICGFLHGVAGDAAFLLPVVLCWFGVLLITDKLRAHPGRVLLMLALALMLFTAIHLFSAETIARQLMFQNWVSFLEKSYELRYGAGALGALFGYPLYQALGVWGGLIGLFILLLADLTLLQKISPRRITEKTREYVASAAEEHKRRRDERIALRPEPAPRRAKRSSEDIEPWDMPDQPPIERIEPVGQPDAKPRRTPYVAPEGEDSPYVIPASLKKGRKRPIAAAKETDDMPIVDVFSDAATPARTKAESLPEDLPVDIPDSEPMDIFADATEPEREPEPELEPEPERPDETPLATIGEVPPEAETEADPFVLPVARKKRAELAEFTPAPAALDGSPIRETEEKKHEKAVLPVDEDPYSYPPVDLLAESKPSLVRSTAQRDTEKALKLEETLKSFGIQTRLTGIAHGPAVTRFELSPAPGVKVSRITALADDIALNLAAISVRIEAPIPGKAAVGVEVPNDSPEIVPLREVLESDEARRHPSRLAVALGKDNGGRYIIADLAKMPHLLIAGATGSGKSVCINNFICSILYRATPAEVRLIMIDPKVVELSAYNGIPHLLVPVVTDPKKAAGALTWAVAEMTERYKKFSERGVRDMKGYNLSCKGDDEPLPQIVVIIDELADLMMVTPGEVEDSICRLAQLARAAGIHLVIATQRPSVNVITGIIKANIPSRIAFTVASQVDSRTILDIGGAEKLLGRGDMLFAPSGTNKPQRVQGAWVSEDEVHSIVNYLREHHDASYNDDVAEHIAAHSDNEDDEKHDKNDDCDELMEQALEIAVELGQVSTSMLQRRLRIGYARAGRIVDDMTVRGYVSPAEGSKPRNVLISREQYLQLFKK